MPEKKKTEPPTPDRKIKLSDVGAYLGVSLRVVDRLHKEGKIKTVRDPLDHRRKLVSVRDLDRLKEASLIESGG